MEKPSSTDSAKEFSKTAPFWFGERYTLFSADKDNDTNLSDLRQAAVITGTVLVATLEQAQSSSSWVW
jgi:hypothetical protein